MTKEERQSMLDSALQGSKISIPSEQVLAMKADLSITWNKLRILRR